MFKAVNLVTPIQHNTGRRQIAVHCGPYFEGGQNLGNTEPTRTYTFVSNWYNYVTTLKTYIAFLNCHTFCLNNDRFSASSFAVVGKIRNSARIASSGEGNQVPE